MRGVEQTVATRIYASDNERLAQWVRTWNLREPRGKRRTNADALHAIFDENMRMKKRIAYLNLDNARLIGENHNLRRESKLQETVHSLKVRH